MILSRTPLRISFFGGGSDYPEYFERKRGVVVGMAIKKYVYISCLRMEDFIDYRYRVSYSKIDLAQSIAEISHPVVREILRHYNVKHSLDISIFSDLPARTGLGGSSSFTVGLLKLINAIEKRDCTRIDLGRSAIQAERELLKENVGVQDQMHAAFGGINKFAFEGSQIGIYPIQIPSGSLAALLGSLVLVYTGITRSASATLDEQVSATKDLKNDGELSHLTALAEQATTLLQSDDPERLVNSLGAMMHDGWMTKRKLSSRVSSFAIDALYDKALQAGAIGGKLCGAGSGGFLLMVVPPDQMDLFKKRMSDHSLVAVDLDTEGSTIIGF